MPQKNLHVALLNYTASSVMNIDINVIYTGAEEGVEVVECTELELISQN